jgi:hypothetical protein
MNFQKFNQGKSPLKNMSSEGSLIATDDDSESVEGDKDD